MDDHFGGFGGVEAGLQNQTAVVGEEYLAFVGTVAVVEDELCVDLSPNVLLIVR